jgi:hypothetical protein
MEKDKILLFHLCVIIIEDIFYDCDKSNIFAFLLNHLKERKPLKPPIIYTMSMKT